MLIQLLQFITSSPHLLLILPHIHITQPNMKIALILVSILKVPTETKYIKQMIIFSNKKVFCVLVVTYEIYSGTRKFLSDPVATTSFSAEVELPRVTLCQYRSASFKIGVLPPFNLIFDDYMDGKFFPEPNTSELEAEEIFQKSFNDNYYLLDIRGRFICF